MKDKISVLFVLTCFTLESRFPGKTLMCYNSIWNCIVAIVMPCGAHGGPKTYPLTSIIVQLILFWSCEVSRRILRNQKTYRLTHILANVLLFGPHFGFLSVF